LKIGLRSELLAKELAVSPTSMRALIIFGSRYGNTERIARSFEVGLKKTGIYTQCVNAKEVNPNSLRDYDLIAVGAPTEKITASDTIKEFLAKLEGMDFSGKTGFAFDTKLPYPLTGSAAKFIEKKMRNLGFEIVFEKSSAIVLAQKEKEGGVLLKDGEEKRFEDIGTQVGTAFLSRKSTTISA